MRAVVVDALFSGRNCYKANSSISLLHYTSKQWCRIRRSSSSCTDSAIVSLMTSPSQTPTEGAIATDDNPHSSETTGTHPYQTPTYTEVTAKLLGQETSCATGFESSSTVAGNTPEKHPGVDDGTEGVTRQAHIETTSVSSAPAFRPLGQVADNRDSPRELPATDTHELVPAVGRDGTDRNLVREAPVKSQEAVLLPKDKGCGKTEVVENVLINGFTVAQIEQLKEDFTIEELIAMDVEQRSQAIQLTQEMVE